MIAYKLMMVAVSYFFYVCILDSYICFLEVELKEEYDEKAYGSISRGSSGALQNSNAQNLPGR